MICGRYYSMSVNYLHVFSQQDNMEIEGLLHLVVLDILSKTLKLRHHVGCLCILTRQCIVMGPRLHIKPRIAMCKKDLFENDNRPGVTANTCVTHQGNLYWDNVRLAKRLRAKQIDSDKNPILKVSSGHLYWDNVRLAERLRAKQIDNDKNPILKVSSGQDNNQRTMQLAKKLLPLSTAETYCFLMLQNIVLSKYLQHILLVITNVTCTQLSSQSVNPL